MDSAQAYHSFWSGFGWKAYDANSVPSSDLNPAMPRITYEFATDEFLNEVSLSASLWDESYSWLSTTQKAEEIYNFIGLGGKIISYDGGKLWIKRGSPFSQRMHDENDKIKRIYLNIVVEFFTNK